MKRVAIAIVACLVALAGPARAWCEASCVAPARGEAHCPAHESSTAPSFTNAANACPVVDTARPTPLARVELGAITHIAFAPAVISSGWTPAAPRVSRLAQQAILNRPLRI